jgi:hypothetical protein
MPMKRITLMMISLTGIVVLLAFAAPRDVKNQNGAPAGYTGSPGDGSSCASCHSVPGIMFYPPAISHNIPGAQYVPGNTYQITCNIGASGRVKFGFQFSPQDAAGALAGSMTVTNPTDMQLVGAGKYMTHTLTGTSGPSGSKSWQFNWTAPPPGTGQVQLCAAFNITNNNSNNTGDSIVLAVINVDEGTVGMEQPYEKTDVQIYPQPANDVIHLLFTSEMPGRIHASVYNTDFRMITSTEWSDVRTGEAIRLSTAGMSSGTYFLKLEQQGKTVLIRRIVVVK